MTDRLSDTDLAAPALRSALIEIARFARTPEQCADDTLAHLHMRLAPRTAEVEALRADNERLRASNDRAARNLAGYAHNASGYTVAEVEAVERELAEARADRDRLLTESAELRQALVRTVAHEAELVALLDPNNDEAVEIVRRAFRPPWSDRCNDASAWRVLTFLRDAANGEG